MNYIEYYDIYKDKIFSYFFYNLGKDIQTAEDLTSEAFLKGFEKFDYYDDTYNFSTWIFTIARNTLYDYYRKKKINISLDDDSEMSFEEFVKYEQDFDAKIDTDIKMEQVYIVLEGIPKSQKEYIVMKYMQELTTKEIAQLTGKTEATVRKTLSRWLWALQKSLQAISYN